MKFTLVSPILVLAWYCVFFINAALGLDKLGYGDQCILESRECTEKRNKYLPRDLEFRELYEDSHYHYCLDLIGCQKGRQQICKRVGRKEEDYENVELRRLLVKQCTIWKIKVGYVKQGETTGHYIYFPKFDESNS